MNSASTAKFPATSSRGKIDSVRLADLGQFGFNLLLPSKNFRLPFLKLDTSTRVDGGSGEWRSCVKLALTGALFCPRALGRRGDLDLELAAFEATLAGFCLFGLPPAPSLPEAFCLVEAFVPAAEIVDFFFRPDVFCLELLAEGFLSPEAAPISAPDTAPVKAACDCAA